MAIKAFGGAELGGSRPDGIVQTGTVTAQQAIVRSGAWAFEAGSTVSTLRRDFTYTVGETHYFSAWLYVPSIPAGDIQVATLNGIVSVYVLANGKIRWGTSGAATMDCPIATWFHVEVSASKDAVGTALVRTNCRIDGVAYGVEQAINTSLTPAQFRWGRNDAQSGPSVFIDDWIHNDSTGAAHNTWMGPDHAVRAGLALTDNAIGAGWTLGDGTAPGGAAHNAVDNVPPVGVANTSASAGSQIKNAVSGSAQPGQDADLNLPSYTAAGVPSGATIEAVRLTAQVGGGGSTVQNPILRLASNPDAGADATLATSAQAVAAWSNTATSWVTIDQMVTSPAVVHGDAVVARVGKRTATTQFLHCCQVGYSVLYNTAVAADHLDDAGAIASDEAFGTPTLQAHIAPTGIVSAESVGTPSLSFDQEISDAGGIASEEAFGTPILTEFTIVQPTGIPSDEAFGTPTLRAYISDAGGIVSAESVGAPHLTVHILAEGIGSGEAFGTPTFVRPPDVIVVETILSGEAFGEPELVGSGTSLVEPTGIPSAEAFGTPWLPSVYITPPPFDRRPRKLQFFYDPATGERYVWEINHASESQVALPRSSSVGAAVPGIGLARQLGGEGALVFELEGTLLTPDQRDEFDHFWDLSGQRPIHFGDFAGNTTEVILTNKNIRRERVLYNRHTGDGYIFRFTLELAVLSQITGSLAAAGVA